MKDKEKTTLIISNNIYNNLKKENNEDIELSDINYNFENDKKKPNTLSEPNENKNISILKPQSISHVVNINKNNNYLNLSDKKRYKKQIDFELDDNNIYPSNNKTINSFEEQSSEKIIKNKKKRRDSDFENFEKDTNIEYTKLKRDLFVELNSCLDKKEKNEDNIKKEEKKENHGKLILRKSTGVETTKMIKDDKKEKLKHKYEPYINFANKKKYFIYFFIIGILLTVVNFILSIKISIYGNIEIYSLFILINIFLLIVYSIGIYLILKNYKYTNKIISLFDAPEKIEIKRNKLYLIIYLLLLLFSYYFILIIGNILYKNNAKIDIKGKGYDSHKWKYSFSNKTFNQILKEFDDVNIAFNIFCWISLSLILLILFFFIYYFNSYQFWKRVIQVVYLFFGQISFLLINMSQYCFQFKNITFLNEYKLAWVTTGLIIVGIIGVIMSFIGFYIIYMENKRYLKIFNLLCILFFLGFTVFAVGAKALGLRFDDYKNAKCNSLFKYISQDYLIYNNDCTSKYLFSNHSLENIICPKERIVINWEMTEKNDNENYNLIYGCINQSCCLKIYCKLKSGFNYQEIIAIYQLSLYLVLFICGKYMEYKIGKIFEEEIIEKFNFLIISSLTLLIYFICIVLIFLRPKPPRESILNNINVDKNYKDLTVINKDWLDFTDQDTLKTKSNELFNQLININISPYNYNLINQYNKSIFKFEYYDYQLESHYIDLIENKYKDEIFFDFNIDYYQNGTNIIKFKSENNIINSILKYFTFTPRCPYLFNDSLLITMNLIYSIDQNKINISNEINSDITINNNGNNIIISSDIILLNYNNILNISKINIINNKKIELINNISNIKNIFPFYLKGNVYNDEGSSIINIYNSEKELIYSEKTDKNGYFSIGPFIIYENDNYIFEYKIEIFKIKINQNNNNLIEYDNNYHNYSSKIKIGGFGFNPYYPLPLMTNILLPKKIRKNFIINGNVINIHNNEYLGYVYVKLYKGNKEIKNDDILDKSGDTSDSNYITQTVTSKDGKFNLDINSNGHYTLIFYNEEFFIEKQRIIINDTNINVNNISLIQLFNAGKIVVKLKWGKNPPDLDLFCRFEITNNKNSNKTNYCYTFFGNQKCVESNYPLDNKKGGDKNSEILEIETVSDYIYFFYVRKYFDISNNTALNEYKIDDIDEDFEIVENINNNSIKTFYKDNDEFLKNSNAELSLYANGLKIPINIINIKNEDLDENKYNYWAGFCLNGKIGLESLKIINKFYKDEPPKNICLYY